MEQTYIPYFSKKILFISILFLLVNLIFYVIFFWDASPEIYRVISPKISAAPAGEVQVQSPYETKFHKARAGLELGEYLAVGSHIKTSEGGFAELTLENNVIRLRENTELVLMENNFMEYEKYRNDVPRLVFEIKQGTVWVNAFDKIQVRSGFSHVNLFHSIGSVVYTAPLNRVMMFTGTADIDLYGKEGAYLTSFILPLSNQVTFIDTQLTPEYTVLKPSKLKKELKMSSIPEELMEDEWVLRNIYRDTTILRFRNELINFASSHLIQEKYYSLRSLLTFIPRAKHEIQLKQAELNIRYLLGGVEQAEKVDKAKGLIEEIDGFLAQRKGDPMVKKLFTEVFFSINVTDISSSSGMLKNYLLEYLYDQDGPQVLRTYLSNATKNLRRSNMEVAKEMMIAWSEKWDESTVESNVTEFVKQYQMLHNIILTHTEKVDFDLLNAFDEAAKKRLKAGDDTEEVRYSVTEDFLAVGTALIGAYRYTEAKQYLKNSYNSLRIDDLDPNLASTEIFLEFGKLLAQRIKYAEQELRGAARPIDETKFREYIRLQIRNQQLSDDLRDYLEIEKQTIREREQEEIKLPTIQEVVDQFTEARVSVLKTDITPSAESEFDFVIKNARLFDRSEDGTLISFDALYNPIAKALTQVKIGETQLKGSFDLNDLVRILMKTGENFSLLKAASTDPEDAVRELSELLKETGSEEEDINQVIAEGLAAQVAFNELNRAGITIVSPESVTVISSFDLDEFEINPALIVNPTTGEAIRISFKYDSSGKTVSEVKNAVSERAIVDSATLTELSGIVIEDYYQVQTVANALIQFRQVMSNKSVTFEESDLTVESEGILRVEKLTLETLPLTVSGVFNLKTSVFDRISHELYSADNIRLEVYFAELAKRYVTGFLKKKGLIFSEDSLEIVMTYPFREVKIRNYRHAGNTLNFTVDFVGERLKSVTFQESGNTINAMSFEEFNAITPVETESQEPSDSKPKTPSLPSSSP